MAGVAAQSDAPGHVILPATVRSSVAMKMAIGPGNRGKQRKGLAMPVRVILDDEAGRLAALARYEIVDTGIEAEFEQIVQLVQHVFGTPMAAVTLIDADRQWFKARRGLADPQTPRSIAFCHHTIAAAEGLAVEDAEADPRFAGTPLVTGAPHIRSYLGAPLRTPDGYQVGALCAISDEVRRFSPADREIMRRFSDIVVTHMEMRQLASEDSLTRTLTRRAFDQLVFDAMALLHRHEQCAAVAIVDIDHFKRINDRFGHASGDAVLTAVAGALCASVGADGSVGRIGGEEFGILLHSRDRNHAVAQAEALRHAVAATRVADLPGITASIGLALFDPGLASVQAWLQAADAALYAAKAQGRDRVVVA
jgi:diguanylate cyclase (GGDEF)-like protein